MHACATIVADPFIMQLIIHFLFWSHRPGAEYSIKINVWCLQTTEIKITNILERCFDIDFFLRFDE